MEVFTIGHPDAVLGFSLAGARGQVATTADEAAQALDAALAAPEVGIVLVTEDVARLLDERMDRLRLDSNTPLVIEIPGPQGMRPGYPSVSEIIRRAVGVRI
jgi:V/A-type H+-transporting ATPase subunit F